jgi:YfiH family protein
MSLKTMPNPRILGAVRALFPGKRFVHLRQDHTRIVRRADAGMDPSGLAGDGLLTDDPDTVIGVTAADCMPIFIRDPVRRVRGVLHSGWKGTGILREALRMLEAGYRCDPADVEVIFGPCIGPCCYDVSRERAEAFEAAHGPGAAVCGGGRWHLDLRAANRNILAAAGFAEAAVYSECTVCDPRFGSYRREGSGNYTRMLALAGDASERKETYR